MQTRSLSGNPHGDVCMDLDEFQEQALRTDNTSHNYEGQEGRKDIVVALLGIAGELGTLATAYKKFLRDGPSYQPYKDDVKEELGDLLWYLATLASKFDLNLSEIATSNISKTSARWGTNPDHTEPPYDSAFPPNEKVPRTFSVAFDEVEVDGVIKVRMRWDDGDLGDKLTDNSTEEDNYRYHDAFHLAFLAILGWSPVMRKLMGRKRKSCPKTDETEDGGRAIVIEEGIAAYLFEYGETHNRLEGVRAVDFEVLKTVKNMTQRLEVSTKSWADWEVAIRAGFKIFRELSDNKGGQVFCNLESKSIACQALVE